jgi:hypothetical protein
MAGPSTHPHFVRTPYTSDTIFVFHLSGRWRDKKPIRDLFTRGLTADFLSNFTNFGETNAHSQRLKTKTAAMVDRYA